VTTTPPHRRGKASRLTAEQVQRALFIDYEGNVDAPPTLLGWMADGHPEAGIVEPLFATCSDRYRARGVGVHDHRILVQNLIERAEHEDRLIVSWSEHDWRVMSEALPEGDWRDRLGHRYRNAIPTANAWHRHTYGGSPKAATLAHYFDCLGYHVPERFGTGVVGDHLRMIRAQLQQGREYAAFTPKARANWVAVVKHNRHDLLGMAWVLQAATAQWF
jgi:hypothetical protein